MIKYLLLFILSFSLQAQEDSFWWRMYTEDSQDSLRVNFWETNLEYRDSFHRFSILIDEDHSGPSQLQYLYTFPDDTTCIHIEVKYRDSIRLTMWTDDTTYLEEQFYPVPFNWVKCNGKKDSVVISTIYEQLQNKVVYPNPARNYIVTPTIDVCSIYNSVGQLVLRARGQYIDISRLRKGNYWLIQRKTRYQFIKH